MPKNHLPKAQVPDFGEVVIGETKIRHRPTGAVGVANSVAYHYEDGGMSSAITMASTDFGREFGPDAKDVTRDVLPEDCELIEPATKKLPPLDTSILNEDHGLVELRGALRELIGHGDPVQDHVSADDLLLDYIGDDEVREIFHAIDKFYE